MNKEKDQKNIILEQAFQSFTTEGPRSFTVDGLANDMHISKKTIYKFFPTKEVLIEKIFEFFTGGIRKRFEKIANSNNNPIVKLNLIMEHLIKRTMNFQSDRMMEVKMHYPHIWIRIEEFRSEMTQYFGRFFVEAQQQGLAKPDLDMEKVAKIHMNIVNTTFQPEFLLNNNLAPADTIKLFMQMITEGILTEEGIALRKNK